LAIIVPESFAAEYRPRGVAGNTRLPAQVPAGVRTPKPCCGGGDEPDLLLSVAPTRRARFALHRSNCNKMKQLTQLELPECAVFMRAPVQSFIRLLDKRSMQAFPVSK
jgi:hypothetical protein